VSVLFSSFLGYNPATELLGPHVLSTIPAHDAAVVGGRSFFPELIRGPFRTGLHYAFAFAALMCLVAAAASWARGARAEPSVELDPAPAEL